MNLSDYNSICLACDRLLLASDATFERTALSWLHVIRPHPVFLERYEKIFSSDVASNSKIRFRSMAFSLRHSAVNLLKDGRHWFDVDKPAVKSDILFLSHLIDHKPPINQSDFFYGNLPDELLKLGISSTIALLNHTRKKPEYFANCWRESKISRLILSSVLPRKHELQLLWLSRIESKRLFDHGMSQTDLLDRYVSICASLEAASGGSLAALRLADQVAALVLRIQPRSIIVTHEGHAWERIAFASARTVSPNIRCIGYQHSTLFNFQHSIQRPLAAQYNPDVILTSGRHAKLRFIENPQLDDTRVDILGSPRALLHSSTNLPASYNKIRNVCLVLPEGIYSECILLLEYALECSRLMPNFIFIYRLHPNMCFDSLIRHNPLARKLPDNVLISTLDLNQDFARSGFALYRGSTAIIKASSFGVLPIYLYRKNEIMIDPLYELEGLRPQVEKPEDFVQLTHQKVYSSNLDRISLYCDEVYSPINPVVLASCLYS